MIFIYGFAQDIRCSQKYILQQAGTWVEQSALALMILLTKICLVVKMSHGRILITFMPWLKYAKFQLIKR